MPDGRWIAFVDGLENRQATLFDTTTASTRA